MLLFVYMKVGFRTNILPIQSRVRTISAQGRLQQI